MLLILSPLFDSVWEYFSYKKSYEKSEIISFITSTEVKGIVRLLCVYSAYIVRILCGNSAVRVEHIQGTSSFYV